MRHLLILALSFAASTSMAESAPEEFVKNYSLDTCHFKLTDPYNGRADVDYESSTHSASYVAFVNPKARHQIDVSIMFFCDTKKGDKSFSSLGFELKNNTWALVKNRDDPEDLLQAKLYPLVNLRRGISGAASTANQTTGEFNRRTQSLGFCLTNKKQILCGISPVVGYVAFPKESSLPQVLKLLESIEFIEPSQPTPATP